MIQTMISQMQPQLDGALLGDAVICKSAMSQQLSILEHKALSVGWDAASVANQWCQWVEILELLLMMMMMQNTRQTTEQDPHEPSRTLFCLESLGTSTPTYQSVRPRASWCSPSVP